MTITLTITLTITFGRQQQRALECEAELPGAEQLGGAGPVRDAPHLDVE